MEIYETKHFKKWARKEGLSDSAIGAAVAEMEKGLYDADLGSGLFKKRIAKTGKGKSGGFRTLVATNKDDRWFLCMGLRRMKRATSMRTNWAG